MVKNAATTLAKKLPSLLPELLVISGTLLVIFSAAHNLLRLRSLTLDRQTLETYLKTQPSQATKVIPQHIYIKWFVDVAIESEVYVEGKWTVSPNSASYLIASAEPGKPGNLILYGHNKRSILGNIRALKGNETIELTLSDGNKKLYKIASLNEVNVSDTKLLQPTDTEVLTIYTCSGIMDSRRFVVRAVPVI